MFIQILILTLQSSAFFQIVPFSEIAKQTGLEEKVVIQQTERDLESYFFYDDEGISCGLESFSVEGYEVKTSELKTGLQEFTVMTRADGPVDYCGGYATQMCFTSWSKYDGQWEAQHTDCENDESWND